MVCHDDMDCMLAKGTMPSPNAEVSCRKLGGCMKRQAVSEHLKPRDAVCT